MDIGIVGAGIAGLSAAIALRRAGHTVTIYEKSRFKNEIGAAIMLSPNGNRILRRWGFDFEKARPVDTRQFRFARCDTLEIAYRDCFEDLEERYGDRFCAYHRIDLHAGLRELVEQEKGKEGWGPPTTIELGAEVVGVDADEGVLTLVDGSTIKKDFIVLADGTHCRFLADITGENTPTIKIGKSVYRWLAPFDKIMVNPETRKLWENEDTGFLSFFNDKGIFMVTYPCRSGTLLNCAVFHDTRPSEKDKVDWNCATTHADVLTTMSDFHPALLTLPNSVDDIKVYTVTQRAPSTRIYRSRVLAIGDTVHHMLPTHAQGGVSALEDAGALEVLMAAETLPSACSTEFPSALDSRLQLYQTLRLPRSATTQILSSVNPRMTMEGLAKKKEEIRKFYSGPLVDFPMGCASWSRPVREFFYGYDVYEQAEMAMKWRDEGLEKVKNVLTYFGNVDCEIGGEKGGGFV